MGSQAHNVPEFQNRPSGGIQIVPNQLLWEQKTEENVAPLGQVTIASGASGYGSAWETKLKQRGIYKKLLVRVDATFTTTKGTGAVVVRDIFPHGIMRSLKVNGNGVAIHDMNGWLAHVHISRRHKNPDLSGSQTLDITAGETVGTDGTYDASFTYEIPLCYDYKSGVGSVFAESDASEFILSGQVATMAELFALTGTATVAFGGITIKPTLCFWEVPRDSVNGIDTVYTPDLSRIFQLQMRQPDIQATGEFEKQVVNSNGNLMALSVALRNNSANVNVGAGGLDWLGWNYGVNLTPRKFNPVDHLLHENARNYNGVLPYNAVALDFDTENPYRDATRPRSVTELSVTGSIPSSTTLTNARLFMLHELLVSAQNSTAA